MHCLALQLDWRGLQYAAGLGILIGTGTWLVARKFSTPKDAAWLGFWVTLLAIIGLYITAPIID